MLFSQAVSVIAGRGDLSFVLWRFAEGKVGN